MQNFDVVVIGAGQAGLAMAYYLKESGLKYTLVESNDWLGGSWHNHYSSLRLLSPAKYASLPGLPFPGDPESYPNRDEVIAYMDTYAQFIDPPVITNATLEQLKKDHDRHNEYLVKLSSGTVLRAQQVIVASGAYTIPVVPEISKAGHFTGTILHSADYKEPNPFSGQRILVVGAGNTAVQIAYELSFISKTSLAVRRPPSFVPQRLFGSDIHRWLIASGVDGIPLGQWFGFHRPEPVPDSGKYRQAIAAGNPDLRPMFHEFYQDGVIWPDGTKEPIDTVIFATGYRPGLAFLDGLGNDHQGTEIHNSPNPEPRSGGISQRHPGLYYLGFPWQRSHRSGTIRGVGPDAHYIFRSVVKFTKKKQRRRNHER
jgi:putative flavoprotein involved in K+ transport